MTSNGILLKEQLGNLVAAGLDAVNISIDTLDQEEYRRITRIGDIADVAAGLEAAVACGKLRVKINCVPLRDVSPDTYIKLALLARDENVDVRFIEMMPIGFGKEFAGRSGGEIFGVLREQYGEPEIYNKKIGNGPAEYFSFPGFKGKQKTGKKWNKTIDGTENIAYSRFSGKRLPSRQRDDFIQPDGRSGSIAVKNIIFNGK